MPPVHARGPAPLAGRLAILLATALLAASPARAMVGEGSDEGVVPTVSQSYTVVPAAGLAGALKADGDYVSGMRAHHAGALTMSQEYLRDPAAGSPLLKGLARAIIHNQRYEIALLDEVARNLARPPSTLCLGEACLAVQPSAEEGEGLALRYRFLKYPVPTPLTAPTGPVTARDVQFARAMEIHHRAALDMAAAYQADPDARNTFLRLLNVDIVTDQTQEIALMRRAAAAYPGDADAVPVPASMIHGMQGMSHGAHASHGTAPAPAAAVPGAAPAALPATTPATARDAAPQPHAGDVGGGAATRPRAAHGRAAHHAH
ncbi:DUF305 domain-containing protein [Pararoseomonas sp. SCSIO 73927]|uniref:DUF305 domain-containing protein n=1 Tax=Pararoseomonas sp. SCSIO 73927 TaxID=3114537 RepID=UPI0030D40E9D